MPPLIPLVKNVAWPMAKKYGVQAIIAVLIVLAVFGMYLKWKKDIWDAGFAECKAQCDSENNRANIAAMQRHAEELAEVQAENASNEEKLKNAIYIYATARAEPVIITQRVPVRIKAESCTGGEGVPGDTNRGSKNAGATGGTIEAQLSDGAVEGIRETLDPAKEFRDGCALLIEVQKINQAIKGR